jgi:hypothetical protein
MKTQVGSQRVPISRLDVLLRDADKLYGINGSQAFTVEKMITDLGSKPSSSSVPTKIPDLKHFGLLEGTYKGLRITDIGQKVLHQDNGQRSVFLDKLVRNVKLWDVFQNNGGRDITNNIVIKLLIQEAGVGEKEARERAAEIKNAFLQDIKCINEFKPKHKPKLILKKPQTQEQKEQELLVEAPIKKTEITNQTKPDVIIPSSQSYKEEILMDQVQEKTPMSIQFGKHNYEINDELSYNIALQVLTAIKKELEKDGTQINVYYKEVPQMGS